MAQSLSSPTALTTLSAGQSAHTPLLSARADEVTETVEPDGPRGSGNELSKACYTESNTNLIFPTRAQQSHSCTLQHSEQTKDHHYLPQRAPRDALFIHHSPQYSTYLTSSPVPVQHHCDSLSRTCSCSDDAVSASHDAQQHPQLKGSRGFLSLRYPVQRDASGGDEFQLSSCERAEEIFRQRCKSVMVELGQG